MAKDNNLISPLLGPDVLARQLRMQRQQQFGEQMLEQGQQMPQGQMVSGHFVAPSWSQYLAQGLKSYMGGKMLDKLPEQQADFQRARQANTDSLFGLGDNAMDADQAQSQAFAVGAAQGQPGPTNASAQALSRVLRNEPVMPLLPGMDARQSALAFDALGPQGYFQMAGQQLTPTATQRDLVAAGYKPGTPEYQEAIRSSVQRTPTTFAPQQSTSGFFQVGPDGVRLLNDPATGKPLMPVTADPGTAGQVAQAKAEGQETGKQTAQAKFNLPSAMADADQMLSTISKVFDAPGLDDAVGMIQGRLPPWNTKGTDFVARLGQLQGQVFLQAYQKLKGAGVITDFEGAKAEQAMAALTRVQSEDQFREALTTLRDIVTEAKKRIQTQAGAQPEQQQDRSSQLDSILGF